jgi:hypothetical protein
MRELVGSQEVSLVREGVHHGLLEWKEQDQRWRK